jgi:hypothetical protein
MSYQKRYDRASEYTKWSASRPGVPDSPSDRRRFRFPLQRPVLTMLAILAFAVIVGGGAYATFGAGGPVVSADHDAVVATLDLDATICCIVHHESGDASYLIVPVLEPRGFFSDQRSLSLRVISPQGDSLEQVASLETPIESTLPQSVAISGSIAYVSLGGVTDEHGVWMLDISDPTNPAEIGLWADEDSTTSLIATDDHVLIGHGSGVFQFIDISQPEAPQIIGRYRQPVGSVQRMDVQDGRLFHRESGTDRIGISDISDLDSPSPLGRHLNTERLSRSPARHSSVIRNAGERLEITAPSRHYQDFAVHEDVLYVAASDLGLEIVDVSDPTAPDRLDRILTEGRVVRTELASTMLYVVTVDEESRDRLAYAVHSFDLGEPANPELMTTIDGIHAAPGRQAIETGGSHLFLGLNDTVVMIERDS